MKQVLLFLLFVTTATTLFAQNIQIIESENQTPISGVAVFNDSKTKSGVTDFDGTVDISIFAEDEIITFKHISHEIFKSSKRDITQSGNMVVLTPSASSLNEVILSVSKFGQQKRETPQRVKTLSAADVLFDNPQTAADLLKSTGNVYIQKSQLGGGSPNIRGFSTNRLLITVDGVRFNTAIFRSGNVQNVISIDPFSVETTEVVLGPGSVIYGSDAVGGVMNFYTKQPKLSGETTNSFSGNVTARYSTANEEKTGHIDFNIGLEKWAFLSSVTFSDFDDLRMGSHGPEDYLRPDYVEIINGEDVLVINDKPNVQVPTGYDQINAMQKIRYMPSENWDLDLGLFYTTTSDYSRYDRLIRRRNEGLRSAEWYYGPQEWMAANLQAENKGMGIYDESILTASYQRFKESRHDRDFGKVNLFETEEIVNALSGGLDFTKKINNINLFYGVEYVFNNVKSEGTVTDISTNISEGTAPRYPDGSTWQSIAGYGSLQWKLAKTVSFQGGLRYNQIILKASFDSPFYAFPFKDADINTGALTGSAGLAWQASEILGWRFNFGTAFRAPNIDDVGKVFDSEPGSVVVPNADLKPEYAYNYEIGANLNFDNVLKLEVAGYYTKLKDALVRRDFSLNGQTEIEYQGEQSTVQAIQNAAQAEVYGFEAGLEVNFCKSLQFTAQYNITDGFEEDDNGDRSPVRSAAPQFGNAHLIYKTSKWKFDAFGEYNAELDFEDLAISQQNNAFLYAADNNGNPYAPKWYTLNFATQYKVSEKLQLNATLENITDQRYRPYSSGISAAGRNLILALSYRF